MLYRRLSDRYYKMCRLPRCLIAFYKYYYNKKAGGAIILFYTLFFLSPIAVHWFGAAHTHLGIILLRYRSELSPSSGGFLTPRSFLSTNPLHSPTTPRRSPRPGFFPSKSLYFFFHVSLTERYYIRFGYIPTASVGNLYTHGLRVHVITAE